MNARVHFVFGVLSAAVVAAVVVWGFVLAGLPDTRRVERLDERRLEDLQRIQREIDFLVRDPDRAGALRRPLPRTLEEAARLAVREQLPLRDPETGEAYGYRVTGEHTYELVATFALPRQEDRAVFWNHPAGPHAFAIDVLMPPGDARFR